MNSKPEPPTVTVSLDLTLDTIVGYGYQQTGPDDYAERPIVLRDAIIERAAKMFVDQIVADRDRYSTMRQQVANIRDEVIRERVAPMVEEALAGEVQPTNTYGEPAGKPVTMRALIVAEVGKQMRTNPQARYDSDKSTLEKILAANVEKAIKGELQPEIDAAKAQVKEQIQAVAAKAIADMVAQQLGVTK